MLDELIASPFGRLFLNELADGPSVPGDLDASIWQALDRSLAASVQGLLADDAHPLTSGGRAAADEVAPHIAQAWWAGPAASLQIGLQDLGYGGVPVLPRPAPWWSTPDDALLTSREWPGTGACLHLTHRDDYEGEPSRPLLFEADVAGARIAEVNTVADWRRLVEEAPERRESDLEVPRELRRAPAYQPDWARLRETYDGVHVSVEGLLQTAYQPVAMLDGFTYLTGWHPDVTAWLRPDPLFRDGPRTLRLGMPQR